MIKYNVLIQSGGIIMAKCPNCGYSLKLTDWRPDCPKCGINLVYYGLDERLQEEADKAEIEHVRVQRKIDRLKASFVGSPFAIIRIFLSLLPIGALMLPLCSVTYSGPFIEQSTSKINAISLYNLVSSLDFDSLITMTGSKLVGKGFTGYAVSLICVLLSAVMVLISLFALVAANGPKGKIRNIINNCVSIALAVVSIVFFLSFSSNISSVFPEFFSASLQFGIFIYLFALALLLGINILIAVKNIPVKYKQCYIGGIPSEEYDEMIANGVPLEEIHAKMDKILAEREAERVAEIQRKAAEKKAKEEEELARKAGKK